MVIIKTDSSIIREVAYNKVNKTLLVTFKNNKSYIYKKVPMKTYKDFILSDSKGKFHSQLIKGVYSFEEIVVKKVKNNTKKVFVRTNNQILKVENIKTNNINNENLYNFKAKLLSNKIHLPIEKINSLPNIVVDDLINIYYDV